MKKKVFGAKPDNSAVLAQAVRELIDLPCWSVVVTGGRAPQVTLQFGQKLRRREPLVNTRLPVEDCFYEGECGLLLRGCAWRVEHGSEVLCTSRSPNRGSGSGGEMQAGLRSLLNKKVHSVGVMHAGSDLVVRFAGRHWLRVFCDQIQHDAGDNYAVHALMLRLLVTVGPQARIRVDGIGSPGTSAAAIATSA